MEKEVCIVSFVSGLNLSVVECGCHTVTDNFLVCLGMLTDWGLKKYHLKYVSAKLFWGSNQVADMKRTDFFFFFFWPFHLHSWATCKNEHGLETPVWALQKLLEDLGLRFHVPYKSLPPERMRHAQEQVVFPLYLAMQPCCWRSACCGYCGSEYIIAWH